MTYGRCWCRLELRRAGRCAPSERRCCGQNSADDENKLERQTTLPSALGDSDPGRGFRPNPWVRRSGTACRDKVPEKIKWQGQPPRRGFACYGRLSFRPTNGSMRRGSCRGHFRVTGRCRVRSMSYGLVQLEAEDERKDQRRQFRGMKV